MRIGRPFIVEHSTINREVTRGPPQSGLVQHRFNEWCKKGVWKRVLEAVQEPDLEWLMLDSTGIRAHHHAAGMNGGSDDQALGRSRGGFGGPPVL